MIGESTFELILEATEYNYQEFFRTNWSNENIVFLTDQILSYERLETY